MPSCSRLAASEVAHRFGRSITSPWGSKPGLHVGRSGGPEAGVEPRGRGEGRQNHAARCDRTRPPKTKWRPPGIEPGLPAWGKACGYGCRLVAGRSLPRPAVALPTSIQASGYIAQWLERLTADQQVPGSNPGVPFCIAPARLVRLVWERARLNSRGPWTDGTLRNSPISRQASKPHSRVRRLKKDPLTAIPCRMHRISSDLRS